VLFAVKNILNFAIPANQNQAVKEQCSAGFSLFLPTTKPMNRLWSPAQPARLGLRELLPTRGLCRVGLSEYRIRADRQRIFRKKSKKFLWGIRLTEGPQTMHPQTLMEWAFAGDHGIH